MGIYFVFKISLSCFVAVCCVAIISVKSESVDSTGHIVHILEVLRGGVTNIPCNISLHTLGDKVQAVIWYKETHHGQRPIYTFDARDKTPDKGEHWSDESVLSGRGYFRYQDESTKLMLIDVRESDAGIYQCRVDFKDGPTHYNTANLSIIVPPEKLIITDDKGNHINHYVIGPFNEGDLVNTTCTAIGGHPQPNVTWWKENTLLDNIVDQVSKRKVKNTLYLPPLHRKDLHTIYTCQASNNNIGIPISSSITIEMNLKPLSAKMFGKLTVYSAGSTYEFRCDVIGSRPRPIITWWLDEDQIVDNKEITSINNDTTTSYITLTPSLTDHHKRINCKATHSFIPHSLVHDQWTLNIFHVSPNVLKFHPSIKRNSITEGMSVRIDCEVKSIAEARVLFKHNDQKIYPNFSTGIIVANKSLIFSSVNRNNSGKYTCTANSLDNTSESNELFMDVKYAPSCKAGQLKVFRVDPNGELEIPCELDANPSDIQFIWKFKYSDGNTVRLSDHLIATKNASSLVHYSPTADDDYPTLLCSGSNEVGMQEEPCVFHVVSLESPDGLSNCKVSKQTESSLNVECIDEFNRGIRGEFIMEVYDAQTGKLVDNLTSFDPIFSVTGLEPGIGFDLELYVVSKERKSLVTRVQTFTLSHGSVTEDSEMFVSLYTLGYILGGVVGSLIIFAIIIVAIVRYRGETEFTEESHCNAFNGTNGCYLKQTGSNASYDSFNTDT